MKENDKGEHSMTKDMTTGKIMPMLVQFTVPLVLGNLFQLTYNAVDSIIVGHFVGKEALAAVGICNPITTLMILFLNGLCMGAAILMGTQYGARDYDTLHRQISTTMISGMVFSIILTLICVIFAEPILMLMQVDPSIMQMTKEYLRIIFWGLMFTFLYNFFSSTLRALGDSNTPPLFFDYQCSIKHFRRSVFCSRIKGRKQRLRHCHCNQRGSLLPVLYDLYTKEGTNAAAGEKMAGV